MAEAGTVAHPIPDFGPVVRRAHVLSAAKLGNPALTVVCSPPGYGKTVLATQLARESDADLTVWVPLYDTDLIADEWLVRVADALGGVTGAAADDTECLPEMIPAAQGSDAALRIRDRLAPHVNHRVDIYLDGANRIGTLEPFVELTRLLRKLTSAESRLTVTCRALAGDYVPDSGVVWVVDEPEMRFDCAEVQELVGLSGADDGARDWGDYLLGRFSGHPAITALMVRHRRIDDACNPPQDLVWYTRRLVAGLDEPTLAAALCAALLREGGADELECCLSASGLQRPEWARLQDLAPLLKLETGSAGAPLEFAVHAVLGEALILETSQRLDEETRESLRGAVLTYLTGRQDFGRVAQVLLLACNEGEIAAWCGRHGWHLLQQCGSPVLERCLARVAPIALSSSARLLLLRSAVLREQERIEPALSHAKLSQRIAEADGDLETQGMALLLEVRLALDSGDLVHARQAVRSIEGPLGDSLAPSAVCMAELYAIFLDAQSGEYDRVDHRLAVVMNTLRTLDIHHQDAAWAANCIASVRGLVLGEWNEAGSLLMAATDWSGTAPLQVLQCRANAAVAYLELGSLPEVDRQLSIVKRDTDDARLAQLGAYADSTLAEAHWLRDPVGSREIWTRAESVLVERGDELGPVMGCVRLSTLCRADGRAEEALANAESAIAMLHESGESMRLLRLSAEIEVAASMLALGDRWGARRVAARIESELHDTPAKQHLLLANAVLAELDRLDGDFESAAGRLRPYVDYIATGSANWRLALYIRAFPGLLVTLASVMTAVGLPLRMVRLLTEQVIDEALMLGGGVISAADRDVLLARVQGADIVTTAEATTVEPPCRVRFFGSFEVQVNGRRVDDACWRKRKVRLLFAMLAAKRGRDVPRDVILERLWPGMDEERARRNFYVTWSTLKRALGGDDAEPRAVCTSGVCRVTPAVRSDLDDFEDAVAALRAATCQARKEDALALARRVLETYRGDLLPGDVYEEWFTGLREQTKHDFCDAMLIGAQHAEATGDPTEALVMLRRASIVDPWREDIYQAMMRCEIGAGQRSRAIETYMTCRGRLVDDLGIDPSAETTRLYQAVLAMEPDAEGEYSSV